MLGTHGKKTKEAVSALIKALEDEDIPVRTTAAGSLGQIGEEPAHAVPALMGLLKRSKRPTSQKYGDQRIIVAGALVGFGQKGEGAIPYMRAIFRDKTESANARFYALQVLGDFGPSAKDAVADIIAIIKVEEQDFELKRLQRLALTELPRFGPTAKDALPTLQSIVDDGRSYLEFHAGETIDEIKKGK